MLHTQRVSDLQVCRSFPNGLARSDVCEPEERTAGPRFTFFFCGECLALPPVLYTELVSPGIKVYWTQWGCASLAILGQAKDFLEDRHGDGQK